MAPYPAPWWVAGGWALDLAGGRQTREHIDLDLGVYRSDVWLLFESLDLEFHAAGGGRLIEMSDADDLPQTSNSIWARRRGATVWLVEMILNEDDDGEWVYRRDPRIRMDKADILVEIDGIPCIKPEIQLLFKAKHMRDRDTADFDAHAPRLHPTATSWLKDALELSHPGHPWIGRL